MSKLAQLQQAQNLTDLAKLLGFTPSGLAYVLYRIPEAVKYEVFTIPKKGGGERTIKAPKDQLALVQSRLNDLISGCAREIRDGNERYLAASHGFLKGKNIVSNANSHRKRRYVFNIDIEDFFGTINFGRVRGFFIKDRALALQPAIATLIAQIACHENALPQGSPCSPIISNLVANILDARLLKLAKHSRCTYTRYADDLTFSTNERLFPSEIAQERSGATWEVGKRLAQLVEEAGYALKSEKTRMSYRRSRQTVTGLVVNEKPNINQNYYRLTRSMCHSLFKKGVWHRPVTDKEKEPELINNIKPLEGMMSHIYYVKARHDRSQKANKNAQFVPPKAPIELYKKLLFYKHFVANSSPIIITEGISDITYLKCAIHSLAAKFPTLATMKNGKAELNVRFLNPTGTSRSILNLGHGAAGQSALIEQYDSRTKHYGHQPLSHPVIILCDNDDGPDTVFKSAKKKSGKVISKSTTDPFYHIDKNLYLIKVPEGAPPGDRDIEDLFPSIWLSKDLDGKPFNKKKEHGDDTSYGKVKFADYVVRPNAKSIDFSGFEELLGRIEACILHYAAIRAVPPVPAAVAA